MFDSRKFASTPRLLPLLAGPLTLALLGPGPTPSPAAPADPPSIRWTQRIATWLDRSERHTLAACKQRGIDLPADFLAWIDADPVRRASVYGCRADPLPVLLGLRSLEIDLGEQAVRHDYEQLALAFAVQGSYRSPRGKASSWNDPASDDSVALPDVSPRPPLHLEIPGDPRVRIDTKADRPLDRDDHIINFLEDHAPIEVEGRKGKTERRKPVAADVIASAALQAEFNAYMAKHGHADVKIDCGDRVVHWYSKKAVSDKAQRARIREAFEMFREAYRRKGRLPRERDRAPTPSESMAWFVRNDRHPFSDAERKARHWPLFPLDAPWPVLLMLADDDQPLREREEIWIRFRDRGEMRTYGEYIGGIAQQFDMQSARRLAPFAFDYGSIQMMWKDGGVCGTMGNIGARTNRICGIPASTAGQPGHCALVRMQHDPKNGKFSCRGDQYATGGDDVTLVHMGWNFDDVGGRRPMVYHQTVAWAVNHDFPAFVETLVMRRAFDALSAAKQAREGLGLVQQGLRLNPFAISLVLAAVGGADSPRRLDRILAAFEKEFEKLERPDRFKLYRTTVRKLIETKKEKIRR